MVSTSDADSGECCFNIIGIAILPAYAAGNGAEATFDEAHGRDIALDVIFVTIGNDFKTSGFLQGDDR